MNESMREGEHIPIDVFEQLLRKRVGWTDEVITPFAMKDPPKDPPSKEAGGVEAAANADHQD